MKILHMKELYENKFIKSSISLSDDDRLNIERLLKRRLRASHPEMFWSSKIVSQYVRNYEGYAATYPSSTEAAVNDIISSIFMSSEEVEDALERVNYLKGI